jgi:DNA-binding winged helix-turn-helix (wHTH) protein
MIFDEEKTAVRLPDLLAAVWGGRIMSESTVTSRCSRGD